MIAREVHITNPSGLHARPAHQFLLLAKRFQSDIFLDTGEKEVKCDSIINLLLASVKPGMSVTVKASGQDEAEAVEAAAKFLEGMAAAEAGEP